MQEVIFEEPYRFIPPTRGTVWTQICRPILPHYLRRTHGIVDVEVRHMARLQEAIRAGHGILLLANHCRLSDPMTMGTLAQATGGHCFYTMASYHLFKQSRFQTFMMRRLGAYSILREGSDRAALNFSIDVLTKNERPLVIFPEGTVSRANDRLLPFLEGPAFMARTAARRRERNQSGPVLIFPVAMRYVFLDDVARAVEPVLKEIEERLLFGSPRGLGMIDRVRRVAAGLLALKEIQYLGHPGEGNLFERAHLLAEQLLAPHEQRWKLATGPHDHVVNRVKAVRARILADLTKGQLSDQERADRRDVLEQVYLAQQLMFYPQGYLHPDAPPEHLLETVERFEEDLTDGLRIFGRFHVVIEIGEPIEVSSEKPPRGADDPLISQVRQALHARIEALGEEVAEARGDRRSLTAWI